MTSTISRTISTTLSDVLVMTARNMLKYVRVPQLLTISTIQPIMVVLLFTFVFGGAINTPGVSYINYLIPGTLVWVAVFGATQTGAALAEDLSKGMIDRFRTLPMAKGAFLAGRTISDTVRNLFLVVLVMGVGTIIGFRFQNGPIAAIGAIFIAVLFGLAFSWISATIGLFLKDVESVQTAGLVWVFPLMFVSSLFVPVETMPGALQIIAQLNPVTVAIDSVRGLAVGGVFVPRVLESLLWVAGILAVFVPLSVYRYIRISKEVA